MTTDSQHSSSGDYFVERPEGDHRRRMDKNVAAAVAIEHELGGPPYVIGVAEVDDDVAGPVEDDHGVIECQPRDDRAADRTGAARHDCDTAIFVGFVGHQIKLPSVRCRCSHPCR